MQSVVLLFLSAAAYVIWVQKLIELLKPFVVPLVSEVLV